MDLLHNSFIDLNDSEKAVWAEIRFKGRNNAITGRTIEKKTGIPYKRVQEIVSHLVNKHGKFIGSCTEGFYVPQNKAELDDAVRVLRHRSIVGFVRLARLLRTSPYQLFKKSMLEFEKEMAA